MNILLIISCKMYYYTEGVHLQLGNFKSFLNVVLAIISPMLFADLFEPTISQIALDVHSVVIDTTAVQPL